MVLRTLSVLVCVSAVIAACGSDGNDAAGGNGSGNGANGNGNGAGFGNGSGNDPSSLIGPACVTSNTNGALEPQSLVFMFDRSGSMKYNPVMNNKWDSVIAAMTGFFADARSANLSASVDVFPATKDECTDTSYETPLVGMTALPDAAGVLLKALNDNPPNKDYDTPTQPAVSGAVKFATTIKNQGKKVSVVLVTDGEPDAKCTNNTVASSTTAAGGGLPGIKTYVIGVGNQTTNLNDIAAGGGTGTAIIVSDTDPSKITDDFTSALGAIRAASTSCDYALPKPPSGETLDINRVNVQYTSAGKVQTLTYSSDCASGQGWQYDDRNAPTKITICKSSCDTLLADAGGNIDIVFGCSTINTGTK